MARDHTWSLQFHLLSMHPATRQKSVDSWCILMQQQAWNLGRCCNVKHWRSVKCFVVNVVDLYSDNFSPLLSSLCFNIVWYMASTWFSQGWFCDLLAMNFCFCVLYYNNNNNNLICIAPVCAKKTSVACCVVCIYGLCCISIYTKLLSPICHEGMWISVTGIGVDA